MDAIENQKGKIFSAITNFVMELNQTFGKKYKPVALYSRLLEKTSTTDNKSIDRHINAFKKFFNNNPEYYKTKVVTDEFRKITFTEHIYLNINTILKKTDSQSHKKIHQHLFLIYTLINLGTKQGNEALEQLKTEQEENATDEKFELNLPNTVEGNFIKETLNELTEQFADLDTDNPNPMSAVMGMVQNGFFSKFMNNLQTKFSSGEMDIKSLLTTVMTVSDEIAPSDGSGNELKGMMRQSMEQISSMDFSASGEGPRSGQLPDVSHLMSMMGSLGGLGGNTSNQPDFGNLMSTLTSGLGNLNTPHGSTVSELNDDEEDEDDNKVTEL